MKERKKAGDAVLVMPGGADCHTAAALSPISHFDNMQYCMETTQEGCEPASLGIIITESVFRLDYLLCTGSCAKQTLESIVCDEHRLGRTHCTLN